MERQNPNHFLPFAAHGRHHRGDGVRDIRASAACLRRLFASIASLAGSRYGCPAFKVLPAVSAEDTVISCDPLEVIDAIGLEDDVAVMILREAMEGLCAANFGRTEQVRLTLVVTCLLVHIVKLRQEGLNSWAICQALRHVEQLAIEALESLAAQKLAEQVLRSAGPDDNFTGAISAAAELKRGEVAVPSCPLADLGSDDADDDDVGWFFSDPLISDPVDCSVPSPVAVAPPSILQVLDEHEEAPQGLEAVCAEIHKHCCGSNRGSCSSKSGQNCFVYASVRPRLQHQCRLFPGVMCHVPRERLCASSALVQKLLSNHTLTQPGLTGSPACETKLTQPLLLRNAIFLEADLEGANYETCAPAERRLTQNWAPEATSPATWLVSRTSTRETELAKSVTNFIRVCRVEVIFLAGDASPAILTACQASGTLLVSGLPARLVHALAEEARGEVLRGLPSADSDGSEQCRWVAQLALQVELRELTAAQRQNCFAFPLFGYRQPLLPHQCGVGEDVRSPCLELWACAAELLPKGGTVWTALLEASCEPVLRSLHADLSDRLFALLRANAETAEHAPRHLPGAGGWAQAISNALAIEGVKKDVETDKGQHADLLVAPWIALPRDALANAAALLRFSDAFAEVFSNESEQAMCSNMCSTQDGDESPIDDCMGAIHEESYTSVVTILRRAIRIATVLASLDDFG